MCREIENCSNCKHKKTLIMWKVLGSIYLPDYDAPLWCCDALGFEGVIYGHEDTSHSGMCEMYERRDDEV